MGLEYLDEFIYCFFKAWIYIYDMYIDDAAKEKFSSKVLERALTTNLSFMDCVLELSEELGLDPSASGKLLTKPLVEKIEQEAKNLHLLKKSKTKKLPVD